jgi:hypothetical protein
VEGQRGQNSKPKVKFRKFFEGNRLRVKQDETQTSSRAMNGLMLDRKHMTDRIGLLTAFHSNFQMNHGF